MILNLSIFHWSYQQNFALIHWQGPVGKGFQSFTGSYLWALDSYTKFAYGPSGPYGIDWVNEYENGTYEHYSEPKYATLAITEKSIQHMKVHMHSHEI